MNLKFAGCFVSGLLCSSAVTFGQEAPDDSEYAQFSCTYQYVVESAPNSCFLRCTNIDPNFNNSCGHQFDIPSHSRNCANGGSSIEQVDCVCDGTWSSPDRVVFNLFAPQPRLIKRCSCDFGPVPPFSHDFVLIHGGPCG
jgi:hypothetical protein